MAAEAAKVEVERLAAEAAAKVEAERLAVEASAKAEAERMAAEAAAQAEAERLAAETAAKVESGRLAAEAAAKAEAERLAVEAAAKLEAERMAAEAAKVEAERLVAEAAAKVEAERLAAEAAAKAEAERSAAEALAKAEAGRLAAEAAAQAEAERWATEAERLAAEAERVAAEAAATLEAERLAVAAAAKAEVERLAVEATAVPVSTTAPPMTTEQEEDDDLARALALSLMTDSSTPQHNAVPTPEPASPDIDAQLAWALAESAKVEAERVAAKTAAELESAGRRAAEAVASADAERAAVEEVAKAEAERAAAEDAMRAEVERLALAEAAVRADAEHMAAEAQAQAKAGCLAAETSARAEVARNEGAERLAAAEVASLSMRPGPEWEELSAVQEAKRKEVEQQEATAARMQEALLATEQDAERMRADNAARLQAEKKAAAAAAAAAEVAAAVEREEKVIAEARTAEEAAAAREAALLDVMLTAEATGPEIVTTAFRQATDEWSAAPRANATLAARPPLASVEVTEGCANPFGETGAEGCANPFGISPSEAACATVGRAVDAGAGMTDVASTAHGDATAPISDGTSSTDGGAGGLTSASLRVPSCLLQVKMLAAEIVKRKGQEYTVYKLQVTSSPGQPLIFRRFSQFVALLDELKTADLAHRALPLTVEQVADVHAWARKLRAGRSKFGALALSRSVIQERAALLQALINDVLTMPPTCLQPEVSTHLRREAIRASSRWAGPCCAWRVRQGRLHPFLPVPVAHARRCVLFSPRRSSTPTHCTARRRDGHARPRWPLRTHRPRLPTLARHSAPRRSRLASWAGLPSERATRRRALRPSRRRASGWQASGQRR